MGQGYINLPLGNHDLARLGNQRTDDDLEIIFAFNLTIPDIPFIYYGNEIGMRQLSGLPYMEGAYKPRAGARTPMQWTSGKNRGFSTANPESLYLPVDPAPDAPNVADQEQNAHSLLNRIRKLIALKKQEQALTAYAEFVPVYAKKNAYPFIYARTNQEDMVLVILNPQTEAIQAAFELKPVIKKLQLLAGQEIAIHRKGTSYALKIPGRCYAIYKLIK